MDVFSKYSLTALGFSFVVLIVWWFSRCAVLIEGFLRVAAQVLGAKRLVKRRLLPFYNKEEVLGTYKGRELTVGIDYAGLNAEFLPLPFIRMRLKETAGYNYNRLPNYAVIDKNLLVYKVKLSVLWGIFDKNYPHVFSRNYLIIALERMLATAEDVERGRTVREVF